VKPAYRLAWLGLVAATPLLARGEESPDVTFSTAFKAGGKPTTANFYFNGRAIGAGREAFAAIVERIDKLPPATSVVWGPNYRRCGTCSGWEPECVPKFLYPDLWKKLAASVVERNLFLSSTFPGPDALHFHLDKPGTMPVPVPADATAARQGFDAILDWDIGELHLSDAAGTGQPPTNRVVVGRFLSDGKTVAGYDLELFFGRLAEDSRVLIRISWIEKSGLPQDETGLRSLAKQIRAIWPFAINEALTRGKLTAVATALAPLAQALKAEKQSEDEQQRVRIDWQNFRGPKAPHDEVLYLLNGRFAGRGDEGLQRILDELVRLPAGVELTIPRYAYGGRGANERYSPEELAALNEKLHGLVPFAARRAEFDAAVAKRDLAVQYSYKSPGYSHASPSVDDPGTVRGWYSGDRYGSTFVSFGRIVRYDERRRRAAARLGWTDYETGWSYETGGRQRRSETEAVYTVNDARVGKGVAGFAEAMGRIETVPEGSIVQVRVCLRTKGPFDCPIICAGHRHFERTGFEPYAGMFAWLVDVAQKRKLEIEWIPDERESYWDCPMNK
jgi:hypothetical protein